METAAVMKKTSSRVPTNSAMYAAGPRSCTCDLPLADETLSPLGFDAVRRIPLLIAVLAALAGCGGDSAETPTLALDFQPNAVHAGIYAAKDVRIRVPSSSTDSLK